MTFPGDPARQTDHGQCGACTVLVNGRRINSCLALAVAHDGDEIVTVEGLAHGDALHPVQAAFLEHDAFQCGYCTPGQIPPQLSLSRSTPGGLLPSPLLRRESSPRGAMLCRSMPGAGARWRGCRAARGAQEEPWARRGRSRGLQGAHS